MAFCDRLNISFNIIRNYFKRGIKRLFIRFQEQSTIQEGESLENIPVIYSP